MKYIHDILHCPNDKCKKAKKCYRHLAYKEAKETNYGTISVQQNSEQICIAENYRMFMSNN